MPFTAYSIVHFCQVFQIRDARILNIKTGSHYCYLTRTIRAHPNFRGFMGGCKLGMSLQEKLESRIRRARWDIDHRFNMNDLACMRISLQRCESSGNSAVRNRFVAEKAQDPFDPSLAPGGEPLAT